MKIVYNSIEFILFEFLIKKECVLLFVNFNLSFFFFFFLQVDDPENDNYKDKKNMSTLDV